MDFTDYVPFSNDALLLFSLQKVNVFQTVVLGIMVVEKRGDVNVATILHVFSVKLSSMVKNVCFVILVLS